VAPLSIVLVTLDTTRADALGTYGQPRPTSPEIDRLAAEGAVFEACVTSSPSTLPSHASILTGLQPYAHGARANAGYALPLEHVTLAEQLRANGYRTAAEIASHVMARHARLEQGFDVYRDPDSRSARRQVA
jgi:arylsulfatase A-like enzyme